MSGEDHCNGAVGGRQGCRDAVFGYNPRRHRGVAALRFAQGFASTHLAAGHGANDSRFGETMTTAFLPGPGSAAWSSVLTGPQEQSWKPCWYPPESSPSPRWATKPNCFRWSSPRGFRQPVPIIVGILAATLLNHALAGALGAWITTLLGPDLMRWILGLSFVAMGVWTLVPDKLDAADATLQGKGIFGATFVAFFLAEMGDKTQIATVALAAKFSALVAVVAGTTIGMLLANVPVVLLGERLTARIPLRVIRPLAASVFVILGVACIFYKTAPV